MQGLINCTQEIIEFFDSAVNQILFLRNVYPPEYFESRIKYGLNLLHAVDSDLREYLGKLMVQVKNWVSQGTLSMLVVVISDADTNQVLERWTFDIQTRDSSKISNTQAQIQTVMKQIISSVSFLPQFSSPTTFNVLAYTDKNASVPATWSDSDPRIIKDPQIVKLTPFSLDNQSVQSMVAYRILE